LIVINEEMPQFEDTEEIAEIDTTNNSAIARARQRHQRANVIRNISPNNF